MQDFPENHSSLVHSPFLVEARSLMLRKDYVAARSVLKEFVRRDPVCTEAIQLLLSIDKAEQSQKFAITDEEEGSLFATGRISRKSGREIGNLLGGGLFVVIGLWYLVQFAHVGMQGQFWMTNKSGHSYSMSGRTALLYGIGFSLPGAICLVYGVWRFRR